MLINDALRRNALWHPNMEALIFANKRFTWFQLYKRVNALANGMLSLGIQKCDRVAFMSTERSEIFELHLACGVIGAVSIGVQFRAVGPEIEQMLDDSTPKIFFVEEGKIAETVEAARSGLEYVTHFIGIGEDHPYALNYESLVQKHLNDAPPKINVRGQDIFALVYTSGTTGKPKGAMISHRNIASAFAGILLEEGCNDPNEKYYHFWPSSGVSLVNKLKQVWVGCATVLSRKFDSEEFLYTVQKEKVTFLQLVPSMLYALFDFPDTPKYDLSSVKLFGYGSAPISPPYVKEAMEVYHLKLIQYYGMTEATAGYPTMLKPHFHQFAMCSEGRMHLLESAGKPTHYFDVKIVDDDGNDLPRGEVGEVCVKSDTIFEGYWNDEERTQETVKNGWLFTGDLGKFDEDMFLYLLGRKKFRIATGAFMVYPAEVENVIAEHPAVAEVCVIGVPDEKWGEAIKAIIRLKDRYKEAKDMEREIIGFCRKNLSNYKVPKSIDICDEIPRNPRGKIDIKGLQEEYWKGHDRRIH